MVSRPVVLMSLLAWTAIAPAQPTPTMIDVGYAEPARLAVAPGQVVTIFVRNLNLDSGVTDRFPPPDTLAGVSVRYSDGASSDPVEGLLPIFAVEPLDCERRTDGRCDLTAVTVQMPTGIKPCRPTLSPIPQDCTPELVLSLAEFGLVQQVLRFPLVPSKVHILNTCDTSVRPFLEPPAPLCFPLITHADGQLVTGVSPAQAGESLTLYAVGMGSLAGAPPAGEATPAPPPLLAFPEDYGITVGFDLRPGAPPTPPETPGVTAARPFFAGLAPGQVGVYQLNFTVPQIEPEELLPCGGSPGGINATLTVAMPGSLDAASLCLEP